MGRRATSVPPGAEIPASESAIGHRREESEGGEGRGGEEPVSPIGLSRITSRASRGPVLSWAGAARGRLTAPAAASPRPLVPERAAPHHGGGPRSCNARLPIGRVLRPIRGGRREVGPVRRPPRSPGGARPRAGPRTGPRAGRAGLCHGEGDAHAFHVRVLGERLEAGAELRLLNLQLVVGEPLRVGLEPESPDLVLLVVQLAAGALQLREHLLQLQPEGAQLVLSLRVSAGVRRPSFGRLLGRQVVRQRPRRRGRHEPDRRRPGLDDEGAAAGRQRQRRQLPRGRRALAVLPRAQSIRQRQAARRGATGSLERLERHGQPRVLQGRGGLPARRLARSRRAGLRFRGLALGRLDLQPEPLDHGRPGLGRVALGHRRLRRAELRGSCSAGGLLRAGVRGRRAALRRREALPQLRDLALRLRLGGGGEVRGF
mmetsp:Transcript_17156/g.45707  ORF Transcript_17156/g.45707 Transcript_17156/m.45707 type:complete len:430 (-) Transcript_17156:1106-2395(-)